MDNSELLGIIVIVKKVEFQTIRTASKCFTTIFFIHTEKMKIRAFVSIKPFNRGSTLKILLALTGMEKSSRRKLHYTLLLILYTLALSIR